MTITNNNQFIDMFEERLCAYTGAPHAVVVDRCTNAILLSLVGTGWPKNQPITIPSHTYLSVPMTLINYGYSVRLAAIDWYNHYRIGDTNIYDYAVDFNENIYVPGTIQCLSFQQKKRLAIGTGGAILLDDTHMYHTLKRLRHDGRDSSISVAHEMKMDGDNITIGFHMYMSPDSAAKGTLLLNQPLPQFLPVSYRDYPDISTLGCFRKHI